MPRFLVFSLIFISLLRADPVLSYSSLWATSAAGPISAIAVDANGEVYIAGATAQDIPLVSPLQPQMGTGNCAAEPPEEVTPCPDIFLAKLDPTGTKILFSTYVGDDGYDVFGGLAVDAQGNAYVTFTSYPPQLSGFAPSGSGGTAFVRKVNPDGSALLYSQSLGANTLAAAITADTSGDALVTGTSYSTSFPAVHAIQAQSLVKPMFVTPDGGATWSAIQTGALQVNALAIPPGQPSIIYAATSSGLLKSLDGGTDWTNLIASAVSALVALDPQNPAIVYVAYTAPPVNGALPAGITLERSADAGATWAVISGSIPLNPYTTPGSTSITALAIDPQNSATIWIGTSGSLNNTIFKSTNTGATWQAVLGATPTPPPFPYSFSEILIDPTNSAHVYVCCANSPSGGFDQGGLEITANGGQTWVQGGAPPGTGVVGFGTVAIDPANSSVLYAAATTEVVRSTDGGQSWSALNLPSYPGSWNGVLIDPATQTIYLLNDAGYLLSSADGGITWTTQPGPWMTNSTLLAVDPAHPGTIYVSSPSSGVQDAFVTKLSAEGSVVWATLLGGSAVDQGLAIAVDPQGNAYIAGSTSSYDFPLANPLQPVLDNRKGNQSDAFVAEISADGSQLVYSTYLGGSGPDFATTIGADGSGNAWVAGSTGSPDFPLVNPEQPTQFGYGSAFLATIVTGGQKLLYSTYLNGVFTEPAISSSPPQPVLTVDGNGNAWVSGTSNSLGLPLVNPIQASVGGGLLSEFSPAASILFSTYFDLAASDLAITSSGSAWLAGSTSSANFPSVGSTLAPSASAGLSGFIARIDPAPPVSVPGIPQINAIYNAASWEVGDVVAPGEIVSILGSGLAPSAAGAAGAPLPASLNGVTASIGGVPAPLFYVSPGQINLQVPLGVALGTADLVIAGNAQSLTRPLRVVAVRAGIFAVTHDADFSLVTAQNPAVPGEYLAIFATGLGSTSPSVAAGEASPFTLAPLTSSAVVVPGANAVGGGPISPALFVGLAPGTIGIYQVNYQLTTEIGSGVSGLYIQIGSQGDQTNMVPLYVK